MGRLRRILIRLQPEAYRQVEQQAAREQQTVEDYAAEAVTGLANSQKLLQDSQDLARAAKLLQGQDQGQ